MLLSGALAYVSMQNQNEWITKEGYAMARSGAKGRASQDSASHIVHERW